jgi:phosphosulfolactate phosphohydrolase-like enzyme
MTPPLPPTTCSRSVKTISAKYLSKTSHGERLRKLGIEKDIEFCLQIDLTTAIPVLQGEKLVKLVLILITLV